MSVQPFCDNRESCDIGTSSSCVGYQGYISSTINLRGNLPCRPNINDIIWEMQNISDENADYSTLNYMCLANPAPFVSKKWVNGVLTDYTNVKQLDLNQLFITKLCLLLNPPSPSPIDPTTILLPINMACLVNGACPSPNPIDLLSFCQQLLTAYCSLLVQVNQIKTYLNL